VLEALLEDGRKPMALRHWEAFEQFVWSALRRAYDAYYDAMEQELQ
jgi:hypothetical protein